MFRWLRRLFKKKQPQTAPVTPARPRPRPQTGDNLKWNNPAYTQYLLEAINEYGNNLLSVKPADWKNFIDKWPKTREGVIDFWANILVEMAFWESKWKTDHKYQESFRDRNGNRIWSRGLFQVSIESSQGYKKDHFKQESDLHNPKLNIEMAVMILNKWVGRDGVIAGGRKGGARYWSVLRGERDYTKKALNAIRMANR